jgi:beta-N-acetylhexosaminidase
MDELQPASTSSLVVDRLRGQIGFTGLVVSDDLDAPATLRGRSLTMTMIDSLRAVADLLLVGGGEHLLESVEAIYATARADEAFARRVHEAAARVSVTASAFAGPS